MPSDALTPALPDSSPLHQLIQRTRRLLRSAWIATGIGFFIGLMLGSIVILASLDLLAPVRPLTWSILAWSVPVDHLFRLTALLIIVLPASWALVAGVLVPLCRRLAAVQVARRIEQHLPGIHNRLLSCLDLERSGHAAVSPSFHRRLLQEALDRIEGFRPHVVLDRQRLRRAILFSFLATLAFGVLWASASSRLPRALARLVLPFADLPPISDVAYEVAPGNADVLREEPIVFSARVTTTADPQELHLELQGNDGRPGPSFDFRPDHRDPKLWRLTLDGASLGAGFDDGFRYRVFGGGTWSRQQFIRLVDRPVIVAVESAVHFPAYMRSRQPQPTPSDAVEVTGPEGGEVEVGIRVQGDVAAGEIQLLRPTIQPIPAAAQVERPWLEDRLPVGAAAEGNWDWELHGRRRVHTERPAVGTHSHLFHSDPVGHTVAPGDVLFAHVFIDPAAPPETILLQWQDGADWSHGAYWGADNIHEGPANSPARRSMGPLPAAGQWTRLEVPAAAVALEGKTLRGMAFKLHGGRCLWGRTGTVQTRGPAVEVTQSFPLHLQQDGCWSGRFPLSGTGYFRAEVRNDAGHANKGMQEIKYVAVVDRPPEVYIERPGKELVLSTAATVPILIRAHDDYGLASLRLLLRETAVGAYREQTLAEFKEPKRDHTLLHGLTDPARLKPGGQFWYAIEARDTKGQCTRTAEYVIRIAPGANTADRQLEAFERGQDSFRERLIQLIAQQKRLQGSLEKLNKEYLPLAQRVQAALDEAHKLQQTGPDASPTNPPKLDPQDAKRYSRLQNELAALAQTQQQNTALAQRLAAELGQAAKQQRQLDMLPEELAEQMQEMQQAFQHHVADAMRDLGHQMARDATPNATSAPDLPDLQRQGERVHQEMEAARQHMQALASSRKALRKDLRDALQQLRREMLAQRGKLNSRELQELRDYIARMREQLKTFQRKQDQLLEDTEKGTSLRDTRAQQQDLDKQMERLLAQARNLLDARRRPRDRKPAFPDSPYSADREEVKAPPREEDSDEPLPGQKGNKAKASDNKSPQGTNQKDTAEEKEPLYMPALGGPRAKTDPRFDKKRRSDLKEQQRADSQQSSSAQSEMEQHQREAARDLDAAQQSLASDQGSLEQMLRSLQEALQSSSSRQGPPSAQGEELSQLQELLGSGAMRQALAMAARMRQGRRMASRSSSPSSAGQGNLEGSEAPASAEANLARLDPRSRAIIMRLPPSKLRDELIQGMAEQGPEAYRPFIEDYFKRLTQTKGTGK